MASTCYCGRGLNCNCGKLRPDSLPAYDSLFPSVGPPHTVHPPVHVGPPPSGFYQPPTYPPAAPQIGFTSDPSNFPLGNMPPNTTVHPNTVFYPAMTVSPSTRNLRNTLCCRIFLVVFMIVFFSIATFIIYNIISWSF